ncbi:DUF983 domain-containing protein [Sphingoaurantiacus capsulatus]|uniref:DUF983 domain-containing protein n=1 Tax=Sphingoaurantiacus capsulatus TaxID=1771310 RepID=A0ABV7XC25_9SPHN
MDHPTVNVRELEGNDRLRWIAATGLKGRCPRCGKGHMFSGFLSIAKTCDACGLDFGYATPDDGPAFFALCFITFPLIFFTMWVELAFEPPFWVHIATSGPLMIGACVLGLRPLKGWLVASQYVNKAQEAGTEELFDELDRVRSERDDGAK